MVYPSQLFQATKPSSKEALLLWLDCEHSPFLNMAIDEGLFRGYRNFRHPLLRFYGWDRPSVSIGYFQRFCAVPYQGLTIVRRPTGGGIVVHQEALTYTLVVPASHWFFEHSRTESYRLISEVIISSFLNVDVKAQYSEQTAAIKAIDPSSMICFESPVRYDVVVKGKKVAGAAQKRNRTALLHQGSISLKNLSFLSQEEIIANFVRQLKIQFNCAIVPFTPTGEILGRARHLAEEKYSASSWNRKR